MNAVEATTLMGVLVALVASVGVPIYLDRRKTTREDRREAIRNQAALAETAEVSWENINKAIVRERDELQKRLGELNAAFDRQRREHNEEMGVVRRQLWELWHLIPEDLRPAMPNPG